MAKKQTKAQINEAKIVLKPIGRYGGLDNIHIALLVLVAVLIALLLVISYSKPQIIIENTTNTSSTCVYGVMNGSCVYPTHNESSVLRQLGKIIASYEFVNGSLSLLPYYSIIQNTTFGYLPISKVWLAVVPVINPATGNTFSTSFLIYDSNLSLVNPYIQTVRTSQVLSDYVVSQGVVRLSNQAVCGMQAPLPVYWFIDPYAQGSISSLSNLTAVESKYGSKLNLSLKVLFASESQNIAKTYGDNNTRALGKYLFCSSKQSGFSNFVTTLNAVYSGSYLSPSLLSSLANQSGLNIPQLRGCMLNSTSAINAQALLAQYYNVTSTPSVVTDCVYSAIPQTERNAICFANSTIC